MYDLTTPSQTSLNGIQKQLQDVEDVLIQLPQTDCKTDHYFADGLYLRQIIIPEGATLTGAVHLTETLDVMIYGDLIVITEDGRRHITKPGSVFVSKIGRKKVAYALKETMWLTLHAVEDVKTKTMDDIEKELCVASYTEYHKLLERKI
jgi:hypothetical protein